MTVTWLKLLGLQDIENGVKFYKTTDIIMMSHNIKPQNIFTSEWGNTVKAEKTYV